MLYQQETANILKTSKSSAENHLHQLGYVNHFGIWVSHKLSGKNLLLLKKKKSFLAVLGLCCCTGFSLVVASGGYSLVVIDRLLIVVASLVAEHSL